MLYLVLHTLIYFAKDIAEITRTRPLPEKLHADTCDDL
jgi:hypothetical protein